MNGLLDPVEPGLACGSDTAHMSLFGYDPRTLYRGRGAFESMGAGMDMIPGDIAFKSNFAVLDEESGIVVQRRADRQFEEEGPVLCEALDGTVIPGFEGKYTILARYATEHRCGVVIRGPGLTDSIEGTDPLKDGLPLLRAKAKDPACKSAVLTANVVNAASDCIRDLLKKHEVNVERRKQGKPEANVVLLRGCGCRLDLEGFDAKHGTKSCMVAPTKMIAGLGMCLGMTLLHVEGATGDYRSLFHEKARAISEALVHDGFDFGFLHVKAVDDAGHDRNIELKIKSIEVVDGMVGQLVRQLYEAGEDAVLAISGDHSTPVEFGDHSHEPVPFCMSRINDIVKCMGGEDALKCIPLEKLPFPESLSGNEMKWKEVIASNVDSIACSFDPVSCFSEIQSSKGVLGRFTGNHVISVMQTMGSMSI